MEYGGWEVLSHLPYSLDLVLETTICSGRFRNTFTGMQFTSEKGNQKMIWLILGRQAGTVLLGWSVQIAIKLGKCYSLRWAILWIIRLYMFLLNKRTHFSISIFLNIYISALKASSRVSKCRCSHHQFQPVHLNFPFILAHFI